MKSYGVCRNCTPGPSISQVGAGRRREQHTHAAGVRHPHAPHHSVELSDMLSDRRRPSRRSLPQTPAPAALKDVILVNTRCRFGVVAWRNNAGPSPSISTRYVDGQPASSRSCSGTKPLRRSTHDVADAGPGTSLTSLASRLREHHPIAVAVDELRPEYRDRADESQRLARHRARRNTSPPTTTRSTPCLTDVLENRLQGWEVTVDVVERCDPHR